MPERQDSTRRTEVIPRGVRGVRVERIDMQIVQRCEQSKLIRFHPMEQRTTAPANRTIAYPDVIKFSIPHKPVTSTMAGAIISLFHTSASLEDHTPFVTFGRYYHAFPRHAARKR